MKRYFIYTAPAPTQRPPYFSPGWPPHVHACHLSDGQSFLMLTEDEHFDDDGLPPDWEAIPHFLLGHPLPAAMAALLAKDFPAITATDTTLTAMVKVGAKFHKHFAPVR